MMPAGIQIETVSASLRISPETLILELLGEGVLIVYIFYLWGIIFNKLSWTLEMLLCFVQSGNNIGHIKDFFSKHVVAPPHELFTSLIVSIHVKIFLSDYMHNTLQSILINSYRCRV